VGAKVRGWELREGMGAKRGNGSCERRWELSEGKGAKLGERLGAKLDVGIGA
jgi:hypothetical protein